MKTTMGRQQPMPQWKIPEFIYPKCFRAILDAIALPGQLFQISENIIVPNDLNSASAATCLTLLDVETPLWTDLNWNSSAINWLQSHCECAIVTEPSMASFALITQPEAMLPLDYFRLGDGEHPADSATLIVQVNRLSVSAGRSLIGPGIRKRAKLTAAGMPPYFWELWQAQAYLYPLGVDIVFTCENTLTALPRTTRVQ